MVASLILHASGSGIFESISQSDIEEIILYYVYPKYSVHNVKNVLIGFTSFIKTETPSYKGPNWSSSKMNKESVPHLKVFITPLMLQKTIALFEEKFTKHLDTTYKHQEVKQRLRPRAVHKARVLGMMTELAFYTGMRIHEIALLQLKDVSYAGGVVISILKTKTDAGERDIPLSLLAPRSFVERFMEFWQARRKEVSLEGLLFVQLDGRHWDTSHTSKEIASVFNTYMVQGMVFHNLRDAFASHLMIRWFVAFHRDLLPDDAPFLSQELFNDENMEKFRKMVFGMGVHRKFQDDFTHMQAVLAKLLGHIGPMTSFESYVHVVDLLFFFFSRPNTPEYMNLSCEVAEDLLQITYPSLPSSLKGRGIKRIKADDFFQYQRDLIDLPKPARPVPRKPKN
jgi:integrase